ncbi:acetyl/propionyl/methylcrotonyl-CoA carboxylase subunit alpha [Terrarubrum flagellatum]|uniref:acetyl/propionyl/methylcrotonyl-CoA carboxylase subunit alpha n=1 Tax=Terrirubrum flagellatum TaxID=2895980 RepID=UPI003144D533
MSTDLATKLPSVLIANRGEIACRVIRTALRLGIRTIAVYSEADANAPHVAMADEAHLIGPAPARESYLVASRIIETAKKTGAACIHPGYGFLSENADFSEACAANGIIFVGPPASAIRAMGLKDAAKALVEKAHVPVVPGYHGEKQDAGFLSGEAERIGYPVLIKAVAGGGGKGMKRVENSGEFAAALESAQREAQNAFGDARVLVEKYVLSPRHIELQVFADSHGNVVHLFERDCSLQRRHQKVIEEAPAPSMPPEVRAAMGKAAVEAARAVGYVGAGTVEFIADGRNGLKPDGFFFMEMNTRLQVEHPVTEAITGLDLVELQFRVAAGEKLPFAQGDLKIDGHAVEARVYAEDPENGFLPSTGKLWALKLPKGDGVRVDSGVEQGDEVTPYYDPMIAKVIAHAPTRREALAKLAAALGETVVAGPKSNVAFLKALCEADEFVAEKFDTGFIDRNLEKLGAVKRAPTKESVAAGMSALIEAEQDRLEYAHYKRSNEAFSPWLVNDAFQLAGPRETVARITIDGAPSRVRLREDSNELSVSMNGAAVAAWGVDDAEVTGGDDGFYVVRQGRQTHVAMEDLFAIDLEEADGDAIVKSPMHGKLVALFVEKDQKVEKGARVAIVEAMKMEHVLVAPRDGVVSEISAQAGQQVAQGAKLVVVHGE